MRMGVDMLNATQTRTVMVADVTTGTRLALPGRMPGEFYACPVLAAPVKRNGAWYIAIEDTDLGFETTVKISTAHAVRIAL